MAEKVILNSIEDVPKSGTHSTLIIYRQGRSDIKLSFLPSSLFPERHPALGEGVWKLGIRQGPSFTSLFIYRRNNQVEMKLMIETVKEYISEGGITRVTLDPSESGGEAVLYRDAKFGMRSRRRSRRKSRRSRRKSRRRSRRKSRRRSRRKSRRSR